MTKVSTTLIGYVCTAESYATKAVAVLILKSNTT